MDTRHAMPLMNIPPGDFIKEQLEERGWTQQDLANILGVSLQTVSNICTAKSTITPDMARLLGHAFDQTAQYWLNLEANYRLRLKGDCDSDVERKARLFKRLPLAEVHKKGWLTADLKDASALERWVEDLWSTDIESALEQSIELPMAARRSTAYGPYNPYSAALWFQVAQRVASHYKVQRYEKDAFEALVEDLASYTKATDGAARFIQDSAKVGVKFFMLSHLSKTYTDGAAFWDDDNPAMAWTGRIDWEDGFWFTVAHESAHVLLHMYDKGQFFVDGDVDGHEDREDEANRFAQRVLLHDKVIERFKPMCGKVSTRSVAEFSRANGISPALVVGCLHFNGLIPRDHLNRLKQHAKPLIPDEYKADSLVAQVVGAA